MATLKGLTEDEAAERIKSVGYNQMPTTKPRSVLIIALDVIKEPMFLLLVSGGLIYFIFLETSKRR